MTPPHRSPAVLGAVLLAGAVGTGLRWAVGAALPHAPEAWPLGTLAVNLVGCLLLGGLLEALRRRGPDEGPRRTLRVVVGSGLLGGLTTTSALALETSLLLERGAAGTAVGYVAASLLGGLAAAALGVLLAGRLVRPAGPPRTTGGGAWAR